MRPDNKSALVLPTRADAVALSQNLSTLPAFSFTICFIPPGG